MEHTNLDHFKLDNRIKYLAEIERSECEVRYFSKNFIRRSLIDLRCWIMGHNIQHNGATFPYCRDCVRNYAKSSLNLINRRRIIIPGQQRAYRIREYLELGHFIIAVTERDLRDQTTAKYSINPVFSKNKDVENAIDTMLLKAYPDVSNIILFTSDLWPTNEA